MPDLTKIATCSYCGTRSVLHLAGRVQHELACSSCGARLHEMKHLKRETEPKRETKVAHHRPPRTPSRKNRKRRKPKPLISRMANLFEEIFDEIEDILD